MIAETIAERWATVRAQVAAACERAGRAPGEVTIVAVSKLHPTSAIREAAAAGATDFGENYAQELAAKQAELGLSQGASPRWHFIGRLQRNKAKLVAGKVALVHAVDSEELAAELARRAAQLQPILLAVNLAGEASKGGVSAEAAPALARQIAALANVRLDGLMTMPPPHDDPEASAPVFDALRELRDRIAGELGQPLPCLSMGMSGDYEVAIRCGATHVRIGTAIFGGRPIPSPG
ncbi:MAG: YggS family pyridoxal phosphate-dependent enzyme [Kofleriaceae bacterium]